MKKYMNVFNKNIQFTLETEVNNKLNFLDLRITRLDKKFQYQIYQKPTTTDLTIDAESHHPFSQKMATYNSLVHRLLSIPLEDKDFHEELNTIRYIAKANGYKSSLVDSLIKKHRKKKNNKELQKIIEIRLDIIIIYGITVSYTHLDVYKRQAIAWTILIWLPRRALAIPVS